MLNIHPHRHTGRYLSRRHTSYGALVMVMAMLGIILAGVSTVAHADINASGMVTIVGVVPGLAPTQKIVITSPANDDRFSTVPIAVKGTCTPKLIVKIFKNNIFAGSTICTDDGHFSLSVDLFEGRNDLTGRIYDFLGQAGPISDTVTVYYDRPKPPSNPEILDPTDGQHFTDGTVNVTGNCQAGTIVYLFNGDQITDGSYCSNNGTFLIITELDSGENKLRARSVDSFNQESGFSNEVNVYLDGPAKPRRTATPKSTAAPTPSASPIPPGVIEPLLIKSDSAYMAVSVNDLLKWPIEATGGSLPYAISWDWGDGQTDLISRNVAGVFTVDHAYTKAGLYTIVIKASDTGGRKAYLQLVTRAYDGVGAAATAKNNTWFDKIFPIVWPIYVFLCLLLLSFWLGEQRERRMVINQLAVGEI